MHTLPDLPFDPESFGDWTSAETFSRHHGKHHAGYVSKLNTALEGHELADNELVTTITASRGSDQKIFNLAAQHFNHSFFWNCLEADRSRPVPTSSGLLGGKIFELIDRDFGSFDAFKEKFAASAASHFGSGWVWLVQDSSGKLSVSDYHDAQTPAGTDLAPLLTLDVWEHAYYLDFKNDRGGFIAGFWGHVNWEFVESNLA
ncbi:superoxide dismutase [Candidatus Uhrbacteria bacterium]|nr:superoxide dismutase [Candidatus Uhrbacteria bacterium]